MDPPVRSPNHRPAPWAEYVISGFFLGGAGGFGAGCFCGIPMEGGAIISMLLMPALAFAGVVCGWVTYQRGWATVRPTAWAVTGGILLGVLEPTGWVTGGVVGGLLNGLIRRSWGLAVKGAALGGLTGVLGWGLTGGYLVGVTWLIAGP